MESQHDGEQNISHFFRAAFSIDIGLFTYHDGQVKVLLDKKSEGPFTGQHGLLGKLILPNEDVRQAMDSMLLDRLGKNDFYIKELRTFSAVDRHPFGRIITFAFYGLLPFEQLGDTPGEGLSWYSVEDTPDLCADHGTILKNLKWRFRKGLLRHPIVFEVLPKLFTLLDVINVYEALFEQKVDKPNFRKKLLASALLKASGEYRDSAKTNGRPAELFSLSFSPEKESRDKVQFNFTAQELRAREK